jgi:hypothetical protein
MSTPPYKTDFDWSRECDYIAYVTDKRGNVAEMNHDLGVFIRYCEMQRDSATRDGKEFVAALIQHCIDDLTS